MAAIDAQRLGQRLGLSTAMIDWLAELAASKPEPPAVRLPSGAEADAQLAWLGLADVDRKEALESRPVASEHPELAWLLRWCHHGLVAAMGDLDAALPWSPLPPRLGAQGRYFYVWVFLATLPDIRRYHAARGIGDEGSREILADLGRQVRLNREILGVGGLRTHGWMTLHFRGAIYSLGRLQFQRRRLGSEIRPGLPARPGDTVLDVHIPEEGRLSPAACSESFARAPDFFARHFPCERYRLATCTSWLLDDQLTAYLPADSNIVAFQRRFHLLPDPRQNDAAIVEFVFRRIGEPPDFPECVLSTLPRRTRLERAVVDHLRSGGHWRVRSGWLDLPRG